MGTCLRITEGNSSILQIFRTDLVQNFSRSEILSNLERKKLKDLFVKSFREVSLVGEEFQSLAKLDGVL